MNVTGRLEQCVDQLRILIQRKNGDILEAGPGILEEMDMHIKQVRGLEDRAARNTRRKEERRP